MQPNLVDLKGQLLARRSNLAAAEQQRAVNVLTAEDNLRMARAHLATTQGAIAELDRTLAVLGAEDAVAKP